MFGACFQPRLTRQPAESYGSYGSYGHTAAWHCATLPRLPGIEASSLPSLRHTEVGIPTSLYTKVGIPTSRVRASAAAVAAAVAAVAAAVADAVKSELSRGAATKRNANPF